jgi:hypothetical protein
VIKKAEGDVGITKEGEAVLVGGRRGSGRGEDGGGRGAGRTRMRSMRNMSWSLSHSPEPNPICRIRLCLIAEL